MLPMAVVFCAVSVSNFWCSEAQRYWKGRYVSL